MALLSVIDFVVIFILMVGSLAIGVYFAIRGRRDTNEDFLMGGRNMKVLPVCLSLIASYFSPLALLGTPAEIYAKGTHLWLSTFSCVAASLVASELFLPIFYRMKLTSVNTYLYERFQSKTLQVLASVTISISILPWLAVVLFSPALVLTTSTGLSIPSCILLTGLLVTLYTTIGGLKAVVYTDVLQLIIMIAGVVAIAVKGVTKVGGVEEVWKRSEQGSRIDFFNLEFNLYTHNFWNVVLSTSLVFAAGYSVNQMLIQRTCTLSSIRKAKQVIYLAMPVVVAFTSINCFFGLIVYANYYKCDPLASNQIHRIDEIVPFYVKHLIANIPGMNGLFIACICSASFSTLSSGLNAIAALVWEDYLTSLFPKVSPNTAVIVTKVIAATVGAICVSAAFVVSKMGTLFETSLTLTGATIVPIFGIFLMGILCPFVNAIGAACGLISAQVFCLIINTGASVNMYQQPRLPFSTEDCDESLFLNSSVTMTPFSSLSGFKYPEHHPEGWNRLFHLSHFVVPIIAFCVTIFVAIFVSLITGRNRKRKIDENLLNPSVVKMMHLLRNKEDDINFDNNIVNNNFRGNIELRELRTSYTNQSFKI